MKIAVLQGHGITPDDTTREMIDELTKQDKVDEVRVFGNVYHSEQSLFDLRDYLDGNTDVYVTFETTGLYIEEIHDLIKKLDRFQLICTGFIIQHEETVMTVLGLLRDFSKKFQIHTWKIDFMDEFNMWADWVNTGLETKESKT